MLGRSSPFQEASQGASSYWASWVPLRACHGPTESSLAPRRSACVGGATFLPSGLAKKPCLIAGLVGDKA
eukprot:15454133-Alexandrium_andersonii.AAC.1